MGIWKCRKVDLDLCACKIFCPFASIYISSAGWLLYINTKYKEAVINKAFNSGKARLDLTQGM
jgi:hypothetical protein